MAIGVQLLVVWVEDPSLYARLLWTAQRDPLAAAAAVQLLAHDDRAQILTDTSAVVTADERVQVRRDWHSSAMQFVAVPGSDGVTVFSPIEPNLVLTLELAGEALGLHLSVADPSLVVDLLPRPSTAEWDFAVDIAGDVLPITPAPHVLALVWPTPVADADELESLIVARAEAAADLTIGFDVATARQRRATVDEVLSSAVYPSR